MRLRLVGLLLLAACSQQQGPAARHVVMVSGRDDHGLLASTDLPLTSQPGGGSVVGPLADGTLAEVRAVRGDQVKISAYGVTGWLDDFYLRGEVRLVGPAPTCTVRLRDDLVVPAGTRVEVLQLTPGRAEVRLLGGAGTTGWVPLADVTEVAPAPGQACPNLGSGRSRP